MDPEGVREIFLAEAAGEAWYGIREALRSLPFLVRFKQSYFQGVHLPLTYPLPKRLDTSLQQFTGMHAYDAIVLAGIDPVILDADDLLNLRAYVERGGGLLVLGGRHAFDNAQRRFGPLEEALPARPTLRPAHAARTGEEAGHRQASAAPAPVEVELCGPHPITSGLSGALGTASTVQGVELAPGAEVLARAADQPLAVCGCYGAGRAVVVASYPDPGPDDNMFLTPAWREFARQALSWLMQRDADLAIEAARMDRAALPVGGSRTFVLEIAADTVGPVAARATVRTADEGWLAAGREPVWGEPVAMPCRVRGRRVECKLAGEGKGLHRARIEVSGPGWANVREADVEVRTPAALRLSTRRGIYVTAPGRRLTFEIASEAPPRKCRFRILDFDGREAFAAECTAPGEVEFTVPQLELGHYEAVAEAGGEEARMRFYVAEALREIPFVASASCCNGNEERTEEAYEYFRSRGFNAFATGPYGAEDRSRGAAVRRHADYLAQRDGCVMWGEYVGATLLSQRHYRGAEGEHATRPCVLTPEFAEATRELLSARHTGLREIPRMASLEIIDEPHFYCADVCHCDVCLKRFEETYGHPMPTWDEAIEARDQRTRNYFDWVVGYGTEAFRLGLDIWRSLGPGPKLHHVLCQLGSGRYNARLAVGNDLKWSPHADFCEFDCYNYMYGHWRCSDALKFNEFHYMFGVWHALSLRNRQRFGFFIQVTDRDVPVAPYDPLRSSSEILYSAVGGGAKYFHLMAKGGFTNSQNCREEKFNVFSEDLRRVQRAAPLLDRAESPRGHVAMVYGHYDHTYRPVTPRLPPGYVGLGFYGRDGRPADKTWPHDVAPFNAYELLFRAFGEADVLFDQALAEGDLDHYQALMLPSIEYLPPEAAQAIVRFVEQGGALICDRVPHHSTTGEALTALDPLFTEQAQPLWGDLTARRSTFGRGRTLLFSEELQEAYSRSIEQGEPALRYLLKDTVRGFLFDCGIRPHARSSNYEIEADVLLTADTVVLVVVSHAETAQRGTITLYRPPVPVRYAFDLVTMEELKLRHTGEGAEIDVELGEREGLIAGLYPVRPLRSALTADAGRPGRLAFTATLLDATGAPARGDHVVEIEVTDPAGERRSNYSGLRCTANGVFKFDEPFAVNARRGTWTVALFDRFTRQKHSVAVAR